MSLPDDKVLRAMRTLPEPVMRQSALVAQLEAREAGEAALWLDGLLRLSALGDPAAREAASSLAAWMIRARREGVAEPLERIRRGAEAQGLPLISALFAEAPAHRRLAPGGRLPSIGVGARQPMATLVAPPWREGALKSPEQRRWLIVSRLLGRLVRHPDAVFVQSLLRQPWLKTEDVVAIAARRPSTPAIAFEVAACPRWSQRLAVREALVHNPYTPLSIVLPLMLTISRPSLSALENAHPLAIQVARALLDAA